MDGPNYFVDQNASNAMPAMQFGMPAAYPVPVGPPYYQTMTNFVQTGGFQPSNGMPFLMRHNTNRPPPAHVSNQPVHIFHAPSIMTAPPPQQSAVFSTHVPPPLITGAGGGAAGGQPPVLSQMPPHLSQQQAHLSHPAMTHSHNVLPLSHHQQPQHAGLMRADAPSFVLGAAGGPLSSLPGNNNTGYGGIGSFKPSSFDENGQLFMENTNGGNGSGSVSRSASASFSTYGAPPAAIFAAIENGVTGVAVSSGTSNGNAVSETTTFQMTSLSHQSMQHGAQMLPPQVAALSIHSSQNFQPQHVAQTPTYGAGVAEQTSSVFLNNGRINDQHHQQSNMLVSSGGVLEFTNSNLSSTLPQAIVVQPTSLKNNTPPMSFVGHESSSELENHSTMSKSVIAIDTPSNERKASDESKTQQDRSFSTSSPVNANKASFNSHVHSELENERNSSTEWRNRNLKSVDKPRPHYAKKNQICYYCKLKGLPEQQYKDHSTMEGDQYVVCGLLRSNGCKECGKKGDDAHPEIFCPTRQAEHGEFARFALDANLSGFKHGGGGGGPPSGNHYGSGGSGRQTFVNSHNRGSGGSRGNKKG